MNSLKGEVNNLNTQLKTRDETVAAKKSEISVYVNTLNDLRPENRKTFIAKVVNADTNVDVLKLVLLFYFLTYWYMLYDYKYDKNTLISKGLINLEYW